MGLTELYIHSEDRNSDPETGVPVTHRVIKEYDLNQGTFNDRIYKYIDSELHNGNNRHYF